MTQRLIPIAVRGALAGLCIVLEAEIAVAQGTNLQLVARIGIPCDAVYVKGKYAYLGSGPDFWIVDVSNPTSSVVRGHLFLSSSTIQHIFISGQLAYLAATTTGLQIVDITSASRPILRGSYDTPGAASGVFVSNGLAYVADGPRGLRIVDVSNPSSPTLRGCYDNYHYGATYPWARSVYVTGSLAYLTDRATLYVIDVSNPRQPKGRSQYVAADSIEDVFASGNAAYITCTHVSSRFPLWSLYGGMVITATFYEINFTSPTVPVARRIYSTSGFSGDLCVSGKLAYVWLNGLWLFDIEDPLRPVCRAEYKSVSGLHTGLFASGTRAYAAGGGLGLWVFDFVASAPARRWQFYR